MTKIPLPKLPEPVWTILRSLKGHDPVYDADQLRALQLATAKAVQDACAKVLTEHQIPVGNSAAGEMACDWTYDALKECRDKINALEFDV
jgi:hypothetical protein